MVCELKKETPLEISSIAKISLFTADVQLAQSAKLAGQGHKNPFWNFGLELQPRLIPVRCWWFCQDTRHAMCVNVYPMELDWEAASPTCHSCLPACLLCSILHL